MDFVKGVSHAQEYRSTEGTVNKIDVLLLLFLTNKESVTCVHNSLLQKLALPLAVGPV